MPPRADQERLPRVSDGYDRDSGRYQEEQPHEQQKGGYWIGFHFSRQNRRTKAMNPVINL
jgi:hypothetical protein